MSAASMPHSEGKLAKQLLSGLEATTDLIRYIHPTEMEAMNINMVLPEEMLAKIFRLLAPKDLKSATLVCKHWATVGEAPLLWTWACITARKSNLASFVDILSNRKLDAVQRLHVTSPLHEEGMIQAVLKHPGLKEVLVWADCSTNCLKQGLLAQLVDKLEDLELIWPTFNFEEARAMCVAMRGNEKLTRFRLWKNNLSSVNPNLFAQAFLHLDQLDLDEVEITREQAAALFEAPSPATRLRKLKMRKINLSFVEASSLSVMVSKLEEVTLQETQLTSGQGKAIFEKLNETEILRKLDLSGNRLSQVNADLVAGVVSKLEVAKLSDTSLNPRQSVALCYQLVYGNSKLKTLHINWNDLSAVDRLVLARAVTQMEEVGMNKTSISRGQAEAIFAASAKPDEKRKKGFNIWEEHLDVTMLQLDIFASWHKKPSRLRRLEMADNDLSSVDERFLTRGLNGLERVDLKGTLLAKEQAARILSQAIETCSPKYLRINDVMNQNWRDEK